MSDEHVEQEMAGTEDAATDAPTPAEGAVEAQTEVEIEPEVRTVDAAEVETDDAAEVETDGAAEPEAHVVAPGGDDPPAERQSPQELAAALTEAERERNEYLDHLRRERAEFENFRRRSNRERMEALDRGAEALIADLLGVLDNFGYVLDAAKGSSDEALAKGAEMVHNELRGVLARAGLAEIPGAGEPFDPQWHEAVQQVEPPEEQEPAHPTVAAVLRPGYRFKGRVLRPASVSVYQS